MKASNIAIGVIVVFVAYELYKNHTAKAAYADVKSDINKLKNKLMSHTSDGHGDDVVKKDKNSNADSSPIVNTDVHTAASNLAGGNGGWSNYVGQPIYNEVLAPTCGRAVKDYSGYCYNSIYRKKPSAFKGFNGWKY